MANNEDEDEDEALIGSTIENRFVLERILGRGGISTVYLGRHNRVDLSVAVKILHTHFSDTDESIERFKREAIIINALNHPNIVHMISYGILQDDGANLSKAKAKADEARPYLVLEHLQGHGLDHLLDEKTRLSQEQSLEIVKAVVDGLIFAHDLGIVHRDIKPSNVMLVDQLSQSDAPYTDDNHSNVKLLDFGIAKCQSAHDKTSQKLTQPGFIFGSPLYMSPEQCKGDELDIRSDIYSLGCMFYEMLAGVAPLRGSNAMHTFAMHLYEMPLPFKSRPEPIKVNPKLEKIIFKCLTKKPEDRYKSCLELKKALLAV
ncbi:MAG: serine/threonine-protein kinase [Candidatus Obscuribacterales bacterium]